jgi:hypothetical protein
MMNFEALDRTHEPITDEFEQLEFLPEQPAAPGDDDGGEIIFTPEDEATFEPPVSFSPAPSDETDLTFEPAPLLDLGEALPFELLGSSLFDDDDLDPLDSGDFDDDLEF